MEFSRRGKYKVKPVQSFFPSSYSQSSRRKPPPHRQTLSHRHNPTSEILSSPEFVIENLFPCWVFNNGIICKVFNLTWLVNPALLEKEDSLVCNNDVKNLLFSEALLSIWKHCHSDFSASLFSFPLIWTPFVVFLPTSDVFGSFEVFCCNFGGLVNF